jgi:hypothetical protein
LGARLEKEEEEEEKEMANVAAEWIVIAIGHRLGKLVLEGSTKACEEVFFFLGMQTSPPPPSLTSLRKLCSLSTALSQMNP